MRSRSEVGWIKIDNRTRGVLDGKLSAGAIYQDVAGNVFDLGEHFVDPVKLCSRTRRSESPALWNGETPCISPTVVTQISIAIDIDHSIHRDV